MISKKRLAIKSALYVLLFVIFHSAISLNAVYAKKGNKRVKPELGVTLKECLTQKVFYPTGFDFDKNGDCWVIDGLDGGKIFRFSNNKAVQAVDQITTQNGPLVCVEDTVWFYSGGMLNIMDARTGEMLKHIDTRYRRFQAGMAYDGKHVWFFANGVITLHDKNDGKVVRTIKGPLTLNHSPLAFDGKNMFIFDQCADRICKLDSNGSVLEEYSFDYSANPDLRDRPVSSMAWNKGKLYAAYSPGRMATKLEPVVLVKQEKMVERVGVRFNGNNQGIVSLFDSSRNNAFYSYASSDGVYMFPSGNSLIRYYNTYKLDNNGNDWLLRTYLWIQVNFSKDTGEVKHSVCEDLTGYVKVEKKPDNKGCLLSLRFLLKDRVENGITILCTEYEKDPQFCPKIILSDANGKVLHEETLSMG